MNKIKIGFLIKKIELSLLLCILIVTSGCAVATFQNPKVLNPGEKAIGIGSAGYYELKYDESYFAEFNLYGRFGIEKNKEIGIKYLFPTGVCGDVKLQLIDSPIFVSFDFGISYSFYIDYNEMDAASILGFYPMLLIGTEHLYGGIKYNYFINETYLRTETLRYPGLMLGASAGDDFRIIKYMNRFKETEIGLIPEEWNLRPIEQLGDIVTGTTPSTKKPEYYNTRRI